ncbi:MAG: hypothetical protein M5R41_08785 [Bacteroidia bacterium]|nr:hypothetical protein [Bacteroidia bacterium]
MKVFFWALLITLVMPFASQSQQTTTKVKVYSELTASQSFYTTSMKTVAVTAKNDNFKDLPANAYWWAPGYSDAAWSSPIMHPSGWTPNNGMWPPVWPNHTSPAIPIWGNLPPDSMRGSKVYLRQSFVIPDCMLMSAIFRASVDDDFCVDDATNARGLYVNGHFVDLSAYDVLNHHDDYISYAIPTSYLIKGAVNLIATRLKDGTPLQNQAVRYELEVTVSCPTIENYMCIDSLEVWACKSPTINSQFQGVPDPLLLDETTSPMPLAYVNGEYWIFTAGAPNSVATWESAPTMDAPDRVYCTADPLQDVSTLVTYCGTNTRHYTDSWFDAAASIPNYVDNSYTYKFRGQVHPLTSGQNVAYGPFVEVEAIGDNGSQDFQSAFSYLVPGPVAPDNGIVFRAFEQIPTMYHRFMGNVQWDPIPDIRGLQYTYCMDLQYHFHNFNKSARTFQWSITGTCSWYTMAGTLIAQENLDSQAPITLSPGVTMRVKRALSNIKGYVYFGNIWAGE